MILKAPLHPSTEQETESHPTGPCEELDDIQGLRRLAQRLPRARSGFGACFVCQGLRPLVLSAGHSDVDAHGDRRGGTGRPDPVRSTPLAFPAPQSGAYPPCMRDQMHEVGNRQHNRRYADDHPSMDAAEAVHLGSEELSCANRQSDRTELCRCVSFGLAVGHRRFDSLPRRLAQHIPDPHPRPVSLRRGHGSARTNFHDEWKFQVTQHRETRYALPVGCPADQHGPRGPRSRVFEQPGERLGSSAGVAPGRVRAIRRARRCLRCRAVDPIEVHLDGLAVVFSGHA